MCILSIPNEILTGMFNAKQTDGNSNQLLDGSHTATNSNRFGHLVSKDVPFIMKKSL